MSTIIKLQFEGYSTVYGYIYVFLAILVHRKVVTDISVLERYTQHGYNSSSSTVDSMTSPKTQCMTVCARYTGHSVQAREAEFCPSASPQVEY